MRRGSRWTKLETKDWESMVKRMFRNWTTFKLRGWLRSLKNHSLLSLQNVLFPILCDMCSDSWLLYTVVTRSISTYRTESFCQLMKSFSSNTAVSLCVLTELIDFNLVWRTELRWQWFLIFLKVNKSWESEEELCQSKAANYKPADVKRTSTTQND